MSYEPQSPLALLAVPVLAIDNALALKVGLQLALASAGTTALGTQDPALVVSGEELHSLCLRSVRAGGPEMLLGDGEDARALLLCRAPRLQLRPDQRLPVGRVRVGCVGCVGTDFHPLRHP